MATLYTNVSTQQLFPANPAQRLEGNTVTGRDEILTATYTTSGSEATNDVIAVAVIPAGARLLVDQWRVAGVALGGTSVVIASMGTTAANANELSTTSIAVTAASNSAVTPIAGLPEWSAPLAANTTIYAKVTHSGAPTANRALYFRIEYTLP